MNEPLHERLLTILKTKTNARGLALAREADLLERLSCTSEALRGAVQLLERRGVLGTLTPLPFLAVKMTMWPSTSSKSPETAPTAYSYELSQSRLNRNSYRPDKSGSDLLHDILETLGETDAASFEKAVELYSPHVIRTALSRVRRARGIRKSRTALFRHLLPRLAREEQTAA